MEYVATMTAASAAVLSLGPGVAAIRRRRVESPRGGSGESFGPVVKPVDIRPQYLPGIVFPYPSAARPFRLTGLQARRPVVHSLSIMLGVLQASHLALNSRHSSTQLPPRPQHAQAVLPGLLPRLSRLGKSLLCAAPHLARIQHMD